MKKLLIFFLPAILLGCDSPAYRNPLDVAFGDPFIHNLSFILWCSLRMGP